MPRLSVSLTAPLALLALAPCAQAEFRDNFDHPIAKDPTGVKDWNFMTGDGQAIVDFRSHGGIATMTVDATHDRRGIWWAIIKREVSRSLDLSQLARPGMALRVEARIRASDAPKRVNLSFNTQRTTDFHTGLSEFDIDQPNVWQTISFTAPAYDAKPGDQLNVQLAMMDWGLGKYSVDVDYLKVDIVDAKAAGPDLGVPVPYRPPIADPQGFRNAVRAVENATIDRREPDANLADWAAIESTGPVHVLTVNGTQYVVLRWDLRAFAGRKVVGSGLLELKTHSVQRAAERRQDFGMVRVTEIWGGAPAWQERTVTWDRLFQGKPYERVFNTQMIIDVDLNDARGGSTLITLSRPVLQRMIDGRTQGIVLVALGSINAALLPNTEPANAPTLRFNLE